MQLQNKITLEKKDELKQYLNGYDYQSSGLSFSSLYMWRHINLFSWQVVGEYACLIGLSHLEMDTKSWFLYMPLTKTGSYDPAKLRETILAMKEIFKENGQPFVMRLVAKHILPILEEAFPGELDFVEDRPNYDYIYNLQELIDLKGRAFHQKRNFVNSFKSNYEYEYIEMTSDMADECMEFINKFNAKKELPEHEMALLSMESEAIEDIFKNIEKLGFVAGLIRINGQIEALTMGGYLGKQTVVDHVEKANTEFRGLYPTITNEFCKHIQRVAPHITMLNREEDMDIAGLRKAKMSFNPIYLVEKHIVTFKNENN